MKYPVAFRWCWILALGCLLGWEGPVSAGSQRESTPRAWYWPARRQLQTMMARPHRYSRRQWERLASRFRQIYYRYPTSTYADDAVFMEGEVYAQLYDRSRSPRDWQRAVSRYKFLVTEYPASPLGPRALVRLARLYRQVHRPEWRSFVLECPKLFSARMCRRDSEYRALLTQAQTTVNERDRNRIRRAILNDIRYWTSPNYTRVAIDVSRPVAYQTGVLRNPDRLYIDLEGVVLTSAVRRRIWRMPKGAHLQRIRVGQFLPHTARVVLDFDRIKQHRIFVLDDPFRIVIDIFQRPWEPASQMRADAGEPSPSPSLPQANRSGTYSIARQLGVKIQRILLDPGHGGRDPGAIGVGGIREKDVTLAIARRLRDLIHTRWRVEVLMTREDDRFIPLEARTAMANSRGVDLFISIHANGSRNRRLRGVETYYLHWARDAHAMEVAARENAVSTGKLHELRKFIQMIVQNAKIEESRDLAIYVHEGLVQSLKPRFGVPGLGVKTAPFYVLMGAQMPAILVEVAFLTHPREGRLLRDPRFLDRIAEGIFQGLERYLQAQGSLAWVTQPAR